MVSGRRADLSQRARHVYVEPRRLPYRTLSRSVSCTNLVAGQGRQPYWWALPCQFWTATWWETVTLFYATAVVSPSEPSCGVVAVTSAVIERSSLSPLELLPIRSNPWTPRWLLRSSPPWSRWRARPFRDGRSYRWLGGKGRAEQKSAASVLSSPRASV